MFEAVILAGGQGTRLKEVSGNVPKPLVDVSGEPFLFKLIRRLEEQGCVKIVLSLHYGAHEVIAAVENSLSTTCKIEYVIEESPLGTGGGLKLATTKVSNRNFIAVNGDSWTDLDIHSFTRDMISPELDVAIAGVQVDDTSRYGALKIDKHTGELLAMSEKGVSGPGLINSGVYYIRKSTLESFPKKAFSFETDYIGKAGINVHVHMFNGYFIDIGVPEDYFKACRELI